MLYFLLVKVFNTGVGQRKWFYLALGWGKIIFHTIRIDSGSGSGSGSHGSTDQAKGFWMTQVSNVPYSSKFSWLNIFMTFVNFTNFFVTKFS